MVELKEIIFNVTERSVTTTQTDWNLKTRVFLSVSDFQDDIKGKWGVRVKTYSNE